MSVCENADDEKVNIPLGRLYHLQASRNDKSQISVIEEYGYISVIECVAGEERCISVSECVSVVVFSSVQLWCSVPFGCAVQFGSGVVFSSAA